MTRITLTRVALASAWRSRAATRGDRLDSLLDTPRSSGAAALATPGEQDWAVRLALRTVATLARVSGSGWRNSCLFRAIAECLVLRDLGEPAVVRLGVARGASADVEAHAWAECAGVICHTANGEEGERYAPLQRA